MSQKPVLARTSRPEDLPQHRLPPPFNKILAFGANPSEADVENVIAELRKGNPRQVVDQLVDMACDHSYDAYVAMYPDEDTAYELEPRVWARVNALHVLSKVGLPAEHALPRILPLLDDDDDDVLDEAPWVLAAIGEPAIEPLAKLVNSTQEATRAGAVESLELIAQENGQSRDRVIEILERKLASEIDDTALNAVIVVSLLDLDSRQSLPAIRRAFDEDRVELMLVQMADVEEQFCLPRETPRVAVPDFEIQPDPPDEPPPPEPLQAPYVSESKIGRNEPCPCGSGKKYKKCCGA